MPPNPPLTKRMASPCAACRFATCNFSNLHKNPTKFPVNLRAIFLRNDFIIVRLSHLRNPAKNLRIAELRLMRNPPLKKKIILAHRPSKSCLRPCIYLHKICFICCSRLTVGDCMQDAQSNFVTSLLSYFIIFKVLCFRSLLFLIPQ